jgi:hypothetical protein
MIVLFKTNFYYTSIFFIVGEFFNQTPKRMTPPEGGGGFVPTGGGGGAHIISLGEGGEWATSRDWLWIEYLGEFEFSFKAALGYESRGLWYIATENQKPKYLCTVFV